MISWHELTAGHPPELSLTATDVESLRAKLPATRTLVVLDDDPTGTQSVADLPVLTRWNVPDLLWALETGAPAVYVMTNSRSLDPQAAEKVNREVVTAALEASRNSGIAVEFVSRSDSTLRGHYPLEPDTIASCLREKGQVETDAVFIIPAFADAGRVTVNGTHFAGSQTQGFLPVGESEFAKDATFGYTNSFLPDWIAEKSAGRYSAKETVIIDIGLIRSNTDALYEKISQLSNNAQVVCDVLCEKDLRALAVAILRAQQDGKNFIYRVGPPFPRALIGQGEHPPLSSSDVQKLRVGGMGAKAKYGLVVVGSHVALTTRQLEKLTERFHLQELEISVEEILSTGTQSYLKEIISQAITGLEQGNVIIRTSRTLIKGKDAQDSLRIAREVSAAVITVVRGILECKPPSFVIAKGGITSSDVATHGLGIARARVAGPMLPGIVSLWEPSDGPAYKIPYIVFAGNVGSDDSLADVVEKLTN